ncbi:hypothetical protein ACQWU4_18325 [Chryseobacterium sp. MIQD13]|uniref:hypothetical protein n=1 Tax=Chryseobacterium sp. MIQD13 TaxID=3422310 RepID=UPI003D2E0D57
MSYYQFNFYHDNEYLSIIKIEIIKLIEIYDEEINYYKKFCKNLPKDAPRHTEYNSILNIRSELVEALNHNKNLDFKDNTNYIASFSQKAIRKNEYISMYCVKCETNYSRDEINSENWSIGSGLVASGGKTLFCREHHLLFGWMEWNS